MRVLIIEDDENLATTLKEKLQKNYTVDLALDGNEGIYLAQVNTYDLIIIDIGLPDVDGIKVCEMTRTAEVNTPILMLTARTDVTDKVTSLDSGADDYLTKPFQFSELEARMRALLRRNPETTNTPLLQTQHIKLNPATGKVLVKNKPLELKRKELCILEYLLRKPKRLVTREMLLESIWEEALDIESNTLTVHISKLRKKLAEILGKNVIKPIYGIGYTLED